MVHHRYGLTGGALALAREPSHKGQGGFTLIELMIALVIVAIITAIAASSFSGADQEGERARIVSEMVALNDALGRYYQGNYSYEGATDEILRTQMGSNIVASENYQVVVEVDDDGQGYTLTARPSTTAMQGTGALTMDETGLRCSFPDNDAATHPADGDTCDTNW